MAAVARKLFGRIVDLHSRRVFAGRVEWRAGRITRIISDPAGKGGPLILPGFVDAHIHIESSLLPPSEFARLAVIHGTVATVSDPHEIANVLGVAGVNYMIRDGQRTPLKFNFGAPSCVPATAFETAGASLEAKTVARLLARDDVRYLSEVMNFPGVLARDPSLLAMIAAAQANGKPVDGHAPGLRGAEAAQYAAAGITTDHECFTLAEAHDKLAAGMKILIREGSAARNFAALAPLLKSHPDRVMFCCDDLHPDLLLGGHIDRHIRRALATGADRFAVLRCASVNPVEHYQLDVGLLREGDPADFEVVDNWRSFRVQRTYLRGELVAANGRGRLPRLRSSTPNHFKAATRTAAEFAVPARIVYRHDETARHLLDWSREAPVAVYGRNAPKAPRPHEISGRGVAMGGNRRDDARATAPLQLNLIEAINGQLITRHLRERASVADGRLVTDPDRDILKIAVVNRYARRAPISVGFIRGFGLQAGAIASSVAHDSHNVVAVGVDDASLAAAVNLVIRHRGGLSVVGRGRRAVLPLPIAGLMSDREGRTVARRYTQIDRRAKQLGSELDAPFMTLSFMALLVIPDLKLSDRGLFSAAKWGWMPVAES